MQTTFKTYGARCIVAVGCGKNSLVKYNVPGIDEIIIAEFPNTTPGYKGGKHKYIYYPEGYVGELLNLGS